jgi:hypothetical protein
MKLPSTAEAIECYKTNATKNVNLVVKLNMVLTYIDRLCGLVVRVLGYRSGGPGSILGTTRKRKAVGLERGPHSLVNTTEELLERK